MADIAAFPKTEKIKIGRVTYRITAFYDENAEALKPKLEKMIAREIRSGTLDNRQSQLKAV